jgi:hypothetical protein
MSLMMMKTDPITPPPELVEQWLSEHYGAVSVAPGEATSHVATEAARWGADQELDECCEWLAKYRKPILGDDLRYVRRTKPPRLREQALAAQQRMWDGTSNHDDWNLIRRALEALPE